MYIEKARIVRESYIAKALEFIAKKYPTIDTSNIKCVEFWYPLGIMGKADVALVAYNDDDMYIMSVLPRPIPGFYRIVPNEESEWGYGLLSYVKYRTGRL